MHPLFRSYHLYAFLTVLLWSSAYVFTKVALAHFTAAPLGFIRCLVASVVLGAVVVARGIKAPPLRLLPRFVLAGFAGLTLYLILFNHGTTTLSPTTSCIVISTAPIITALLARLFLGERIGPHGWAAILLAFAGILVMTLWEGTVEVNRGVLWVAGAAFLISTYNLLQRSLAKTCAPLQITAYCFFAGTLTMLPFVPETLRQVAAAPASACLIALFLGIFPSALAYLSWAKAMAIAPKASYVAAYMFLTPFLSLALEYAIISQYPDAGTLIGGTIIMAGLVLFAMAGKGERKAKQR